MTQSAALGKFLEDMAPQLERLAEVMERVRSDPSGAMEQLNRYAEQAKAGLAAEQRQGRRFFVQDRATGEPWKPGLTWTEDAADRALAQARKGEPGREWILREVSA